MARQSQIVMLDHYVMTSFNQFTRYNDKISRNLIVPNVLFKVVGRLHIEVDLNNFKASYIDKFISNRHNHYMKNFIHALQYEMLHIINEYQLKEGESFIYDFKYLDAIYRKEAKCYFFTKVL